jgi:hypothetical protein
MPAQCVSSSASLSLSAYLRVAQTAKARFNSRSVSTFACAIGKISYSMRKAYFPKRRMGNRYQHDQIDWVCAKYNDFAQLRGLRIII